MAGTRRRQTVGGFPVGSWGPLGDVAAGGTVNLDLDAQESGSDTFAAAVTVLVQATLAAQESGSDTLAADVDVLVQASLQAQEAGSDALAAAASVLVQLDLQVQEAPDVFAATASVLVQAVLGAQEPSQDTFTAVVDVEGDPEEPEESGGGGLPLKNARATALFAAPPRPAPAEPEVTEVAEAARQVVARPLVRGDAARGRMLLEQLGNLQFPSVLPAPAPRPAVVDQRLGRLAKLQVDILLVDLEAVALRMHLAAIAAAEAREEEDQAIAMLLLMAD